MAKDQFQACVRLKIERRKTSDSGRIDQIDDQIRELEPFLSHEEAVYIVKHYEMVESRGIPR